MDYKLDTKIRFVIAIGREKEELFSTMEELGFTQEVLNDYTRSEIEGQLQEMYDNWQMNYLDAGWSVEE